MEYGVKDAQQRSLTSRQERSKLLDRLQSARKESGTLRDYSRRRFQTVVDWETRQHPPPQYSTLPATHPQSRPKTTIGTRHLTSFNQPPPSPTTPTNGPTKDGSILYNGKPLLLSSIRTRPNSEPPSRFDHLRGAHSKNYPYIQRTLEQSNCEYRVGASPCSTAREDGRERAFSPDFVMLIPVTSQASDDEDEGDDDGGGDAVVEAGEADNVRWQQGQAWTEDAPLLASTARSRSPRSEEESEVRAGSEEQGQLDSARSLTNRSQSPAISLPVLTVAHPSPDDTTSTADHKVTAQSPHGGARKAVSPVPSQTKPQSRPSTPASTGRPSSSRTHSARSETSSVSSVSFTHHPHCWVDDVTISSDESVTERELSIQNDLDDRVSVHSQDPTSRAQPLGLSAQVPRVSSPSGEKKRTIQITKRVSSPLLRRTSGGKNKAGGCPRSLKQSTSGSKAGGKSVTGEEGLPVLKEGGEWDEVTLPRFVCPSSESKSRQAAIKEWLAKTSFGTACRTVPLL